MKKQNRQDSKANFDKDLMFNSVLTVFVLVLALIGFEFSSQIQNLKEVTDTIDYISDVNAQMQRLVRMEISGEYADKLITDIHSLIQNLETSDYDILTDVESDTGKSFLQVKEGWIDLETEIYRAREVGWKASRLLYSAETTYYATERLTDDLMSYFTYLPSIISMLQFAITGFVILLLCSMILRSLQYVSVIRKQKQEVYDSYLDSSTGLYNRTKCQQLLVETTISEKNSVLILYDLNNLKKTNDTLGHICGDSLISALANALKEAKALNPENPFLGRYGGDEFIAYFDKANESELTAFLETVNNYVTNFNQTESRFQVSFAVGVAYSSEIEEKNSIESLFSLADERMYKNKVAMKNK